MYVFTDLKMKVWSREAGSLNWRGVAVTSAKAAKFNLQSGHNKIYITVYTVQITDFRTRKRKEGYDTSEHLTMRDMDMIKNLKVN